MVISGHTHRAYNCRIDGRLVTSGDMSAPSSRRSTARSTPGRPTSPTRRRKQPGALRASPKDPRQTALIAAYERWPTAGAARGGPHRRRADAERPAPNGESPLGQVIADAQLAATRDAGAQIALMNLGGIRARCPCRPTAGALREPVRCNRSTTTWSRSRSPARSWCRCWNSNGPAAQLPPAA